MTELDSKVVRLPNGAHERHTWFTGAQEDLGHVIDGYKGTETFVRSEVIKPVVVFDVVDRQAEDLRNHFRAMRKEGR